LDLDNVFVAGLHLAAPASSSSPIWRAMASRLDRRTEPCHRIAVDLEVAVRDGTDGARRRLAGTSRRL